jgi:hypothetical protein
MNTKHAIGLRVAASLAAAGLLIGASGSAARAQNEPARCTSFIPLFPDPGLEPSYTFPLHYGAFADVEVGAVGSGVLRLEVTVFEDSVLRDRRIWTLVPGEVELLTEILDVPNLFAIGRPLLVRMSASGPVSAMLIRD